MGGKANGKNRTSKKSGPARKAAQRNDRLMAALARALRIGEDIPPALKKFPR